MDNKLKDMLNSIPIPDNLDEKIEMGFDKGRSHELLRKRKLRKALIALAASVLVIISSVNIIGMEKVEAAIRQMLQYVPGYNVLVDKEEGKVLALKEEVYYEKDGIYVNIKAASKLKNELLINVESNYRNYKFGKEIYLKDEKSNIISPNGWSTSGGGDFWKGDYLFELDGDATEYSLMVGSYEIPFSLEKTIEVEDLIKLGPYTKDKGVTIVALKKPMDEKLKISLLNKSEDKRVVDYPFAENLMAEIWNPNLEIEKTMYIIDEEGNKTYPQIPSSFGNLMSDFYFNITDKEGLKLILPYVKVNYPDLKTEKIKIQTPKDGEVESINKTLNLGQFEIEIIDVIRTGDEIIVSLKANSLEDEIIDEIKIWGINGYGIAFNEEKGYTELFLDYKEVGRRFSLYFSSPTTILLGNWIIDLEQ